MTTVSHELLPNSYLLKLAPGPEGDSEEELARSLYCAERSGKPEVWIDCSQLAELSDEASRLLWAVHYQLQERFARLVLAHVAEPVRRVLLAQHVGPMLRVVPTLHDAARLAPPMLRAEAPVELLAYEA